MASPWERDSDSSYDFLNRDQDEDDLCKAFGDKVNIEETEEEMQAKSLYQKFIENKEIDAENDEDYIYPGSDAAESSDTNSSDDDSEDDTESIDEESDLKEELQELKNSP